ncbi:hypothetical protein FE257_009868 [Aspergillus nanangensis]|uniref:BZIP transcription factor n=1 Tax=Aspergillus nanangensis TaxID=2582783 RepID=A0AAD4CVW9_ASPNN|nr:hypothetical protein FE257_009868 [Aspergillus nanangensis]
MTEDHLLTPSEKKRLRDRRAQRVLREKRERQIKALEEKVEFCQAHHSSSSITPSDPSSSDNNNNNNNNNLRAQIHRLQAENQILVDRQSQLLQLTSSWTSHQSPSSSSPESTTTPSSSSIPIPIPITTVSQLLLDEPCSPSSPTKPIILTTTHNEPNNNNTYNNSSLSSPLPPQIPSWTLTPSEDTLDAAIAPATCPWLTRPDLIAACPDEPSPLDLLHGTRRNFLADAIHRSLRSHHCRDPEVLAMGYLVYYYSKWRVSPSRARYARLPEFMRPVLGQLQRPHPQCLDQIVWPQLRVNLIERVSRDRLVAVTELLGCCLKVRWKWGRDVLERDAGDVLRVKRSFVETFMEVDGWGITNEFIEEYPELLGGMDLGRIVYTIT